MKPHDAADAFAAVVLERDRLFALLDQVFVEHVEHLQERHVRVDVVDLVAHHACPGRCAFFCRQMFRVRFALLVAPLARMHVLEFERLFVQLRRLARARDTPRRRRTR